MVTRRNLMAHKKADSNKMIKRYENTIEKIIHIGTKKGGFSAPLSLVVYSTL